MPDGRSSKARAGQKRRSSLACQSCRMSKTKCEVLATESRCRRCVETSTTCFFPASRRGRVKGSKNLRTLQRLRSDQRTPLGSRGSTSGRVRGEVLENRTYSSSPGPMPREADDGQRFSVQQSDARRGLGPAPRSGTSTPWDVRALVTAPEGEQLIHRPTLARKLLQILGEFPVEENRSDDGTAGTAEAKALQDPLWLMAGLAKRGWALHRAHDGEKAEHDAALTPGSLPAEDAERLSKWTPQAIQEIEKESSHYFKHGLLGSKCDVAHDLDPIQHGLVSEDKANELFESYWELLHPQWSILDPSLHTLAFVRSRSALLTTTIMALASTALTMLPQSSNEQIEEALRLHAHAEKLNLVVYATGARSVDIVQAQILFSRWGSSPKSRLDEQRWIRAAMIPRMAFEIGLNIPRRYDDSDGIEAEKAERLRWNDVRTRAFMIINEYRFFTFSGRQPMDLSQFELNDSELDDMTRLGKDRSNISLAAFYHLFLFDRAVRRRLEQYQPGPQAGLSLDAELEHVKSYIERWMKDWCPGESDLSLSWHLSHDGLSCWLLLAILIARKRPMPDQSHQQQSQQLLVHLSTRIFKESLRAPRAVRLTHRAAIFPFAASILLRLGARRDLVLRAALRMAGEPGKPYVPTFVREAGNQMLVMLCTNNLWSPASKPPAAGDCPRNLDNPGMSAEQGSSDPQKDDVPSAQDQELSRPDGNLIDFHSLLQLGPLSGSEVNASNLLTFSFADIPLDLGPIPQNSAPDSIFHPCTGFEAYLGMSSPGCRNADREAPSGMASRTSCLDPNFELPSMAPNQTLFQQTQDPLTWRAGENPSTAALNSNGAGEVRIAQREVLLAAVDRLMQLATLME